MEKKKLPLPTIQIDTREQQPWTFAHAYRSEKISGTFSCQVQAGDYAIKDMPNLVAIERKKHVGELYNNFIPVANYERFEREMERMKSVKHKYIIVEQTWDALYDSRNFSFAKRNMSYAGNIVLGFLINIMSKYGVQVIFAGRDAEHTATTILLKHYYDELKNAR